MQKQPKQPTQAIKLSKEKKKKIEHLIRNSKKKNKKTISAGETIPYKEIYKDGICELENNRFSKTIYFSDINYKLAEDEDKREIFKLWCDFINSFDNSLTFQFSFVNNSVNFNNYNNVLLQPKNDKYDTDRKTFSDILVEQLSKGNNGKEKNRYLTVGITADNIKTARTRFARIENTIWNGFRKLGVGVAVLNGKERLNLLHDMLKMNEEEFIFEWDWLVPSGLSTKDFILPSSFKFTKNTFESGEKQGKVSFLHILAPTLKDNIIADFLELDSNLVLTLHIEAIEQVQAIKLIKRKLSDVQKMTIEEQKKAVRGGWDIDIIPNATITYAEETKKFLEDLESNNEKMFLITVLLLNSTDTKKELDNIFLQAKSIANIYNCPLISLDYQQEQGLISSLPLGLNQIEIKRTLTTTSTAVFIPFTTQELYQSHKEALYYGVNATSNNLIMIDRNKLQNPNGLIFGSPGSGKSFTAKREIYNIILALEDTVIICDPEGEYFPLVEELDGQVVKISPVSKHYINPLDFNINYSDEEKPISLKSDFIISLCEIIVDRKTGLTAQEKSIIDRCVKEIYKKYLANPIPENLPILEDLYNELGKQEDEDAKQVYSALEFYVTGSLNVFNHHTNVNLDNRLVCFDIKGLGKQLKRIGMFIVQDQVWNKVTSNREKSNLTRYYMDEFHLLLKDEMTAAFSVEIWKRFRKWGGIPTGITQNVSDLMSSREIKNIIENTDFICMLSQGKDARKFLSEQLGISSHQLSYITGAEQGSGLIFYGNTIVPFIGKFPKDNNLYEKMTTKPSEVTYVDE
ncbi:MAG: ATP-binding protein [Clostridia bacterium]